MTEVHIIALLCTGLAQGLCSGVLGAGGGWIMTPVQYWVYTDMGISPDIAIRMAFATGLFVILPATAASAWGHHRRRAVWWKPMLVMGGCGLVGSFCGATVATHVSASPLKIVFGLTVLAIAVRMLTATSSTTTEGPKDNPRLWAAWAFPLSFMAGLIGIGGGLFIVPIMVLIFRFPMRMAVGTSAATISMISIGGITGYIVNGLGVKGIPSPSMGYVYIWAWLCLVGTGIFMTQVGVRIAHRLPAKQLGWIFSAAALYVGLRMIGVFGWLT
ncbi:MAG: sulfite exporter TauE/SafE family protein [Dehalococcoidia bacterium]|nr:sulfite exporter TauE/SafE family protein [Dehalococcoidia bacterium]